MPENSILLVDDEQDFVRALAKRLTARKMTVETAENGKVALEKMRDYNFDVVVLDLAMPVMDGIETLKHILENEPDQQVILLTGHATIESAFESTKLGASDFLQKPVDFSTLLEKIKAAGTQKTLLVEKRNESAVADLLLKKGW